jgi:hypothetical protein
MTVFEAKDLLTGERIIESMNPDLVKKITDCFVPKNMNYFYVPEEIEFTEKDITKPDTIVPDLVG